MSGVLRNLLVCAALSGLAGGNTPPSSANPSFDPLVEGSRCTTVELHAEPAPVER